MKIYPVANVNRIALYQKQVEGQISPSLVEIKGKKKYEVEKIE